MLGNYFDGGGPGSHLDRTSAKHQNSQGYGIALPRPRRKSKEVVDSLRETTKKRGEKAFATLAAMVVPPAILAALGIAVVWIGAGFRRKAT